MTLPPAPSIAVPSPPPSPSVSLAVRPPARRARHIALGLSVVAVGFTLAFGVSIRRALALVNDAEAFPIALAIALCWLLVALLFRMCAAVCELLWLERTWSNLPEHLRNVGPVDKVSSGLVVGLSVVPGIAWVWKLGLVVSISDGFERIRTMVPFRTPVPKKLGMAAVIVGWVPGLNVYVAPFLWEVFATRVDAACLEIAQNGSAPNAPPEH